MKFGIRLPMRGPEATAKNIFTLAAAAERLGYESVWGSDHVVLPGEITQSRYPYSPTGQVDLDTFQHYLEPMITLAAVAGRCRSVGLGVSVLILPYREVLLSAKILATLDHLCGGRLSVGVGVGWLKEEFELLGASFEERGPISDEYLQAFRELWTSEWPRFQGRYLQFGDIRFYPKPDQKPHPPLLVGGESRPAIRRAARLGDGWLPFHPTRPQLEDGISRLHDEARSAGRRPEDLEVTCVYTLELLDTPTEGGAERPFFHGHPEEVVQDVKTLSALGVHRVALGLPQTEAALAISTMERFTREVLPHL